MEPLLALLLQVALTLVLAAAVEVPVALYITRPKVRADTTAAVAAAETRLVASLKPPETGVMRGGVDPMVLNERKAEKAEQRAVAATLAEVEVKTFLADRLGPRGVEVARNVLGEETLAKVYSTGDRWRHTLSPFLSRLPAAKPQANGTEAARNEAAPYLME